MPKEELGIPSEVKHPGCFEAQRQYTKIFYQIFHKNYSLLPERTHQYI